ncbi:MAG: cell wall hydrolase [Novosphingobium sp.]|nr:cell wall hydrolase [Novosphingobium sp.]
MENRAAAMSPCSAPSEPRPRDFAARIARRRRATLGRKQPLAHNGRRAAVLLAAVAVPAFATPQGWGRFEIGNAGHAAAPIEPMPFEQAGASFPGSAFYYLAADPPAPLLGAGIHSDAEDAPTRIDPFAGPAARALRIDNSGVDRTRALECLTTAIYYEAASEPDAGQRAVAQVVLNRVAHPSFPKTVCGVVYQGSERSSGCQFSFACDGALARAPSRFFWLRAEEVARQALAGSVYAPVGLATHYHTIAVHPYWADTLSFIGTIGAHRFYRFGGPAGAPATFRFAYAGGEPIAAPHPHDAAADAAPAPDPVALQRAYLAGLKTAQTAAVTPTAGGLAAVRPAPPPMYAADLQGRGGEALYRGDRLPEATGVRPEWQNSGRWIVRPGT